MISPDLYIVLIFIFTLIKIASSMSTPPINGNNDNIVTSSSTTTTTTKVPSDPNNPYSSQAEIIQYFNATGTTCCHIQTNCESCRNFYDVNGIKYCCPGCNGLALVTNLVCSCYPPSNFDTSIVRCKVGNMKVVGDYFPWRPSYFSSGVDSIALKSQPISCCIVCSLLISFFRSIL